MNVLTAIAKSFAPPAAYEEAAFEWKWKSIAYILALSAICAAATSAMSAKPLSDFYEKFILPAIPLMESVEISRAGVKTPDGSPWNSSRPRERLSPSPPPGSSMPPP